VNARLEGSPGLSTEWLLSSYLRRGKVEAGGEWEAVRMLFKELRGRREELKDGDVVRGEGTSLCSPGDILCGVREGRT